MKEMLYRIGRSLRIDSSGQKRMLRLNATISLGGRNCLALVSAHGQEFLVGYGANGVTQLVPITESCGGFSEERESL